LSKYAEKHAAFDHFESRKAFFEGCSFFAWHHFGAHPATDNLGRKGYVFRTWAPNAAAISVVGDFNNWDYGANPMEKQANGIWEAFLCRPKPLDSYQYAVYSAQGTFIGKADPYAFHSAVRPHVSSKIYDLTDTYTWADRAWLDYRARCTFSSGPLNIYECHLGSWRRTGDGQFLTYREIASYLVPHLKALGYTHVEFLPIAEHPLDESWGYQCTGWFAPTSRFGAPNDLRYLIDQLHQAGIGVILDWTPSAFPDDAFGLSRFDSTPTYECSPPHPGSVRLRGDNRFDLSRGEVRSFLYSSVLFWLEEYHIDGFRVGGLAPMLSHAPADAAGFFRTLTRAVADAYPDVLMIAADAPVGCQAAAPISSGGLGFHFQWNPKWTSRPTGASDVLTVSHDAVAPDKASLLGRMPGSDEQKFARVRAFHACMMTLPGKKLSFMGNEYAQRYVWRSEYSLDWHLLDDPDHARMLAFTGAMNRFYLANPALWELDGSPTGFLRLVDTPSHLAFLRCDRSGDALLVVCNRHTEALEPHRFGVPCSGIWERVFTTDDRAFGGTSADTQAVSSEPVPCHGQAQSVALSLPPLSCEIWRCVRKAIR